MENDLSVLELFACVQRSVKEATGGSQEPFIQSLIAGPLSINDAGRF